MDSELDVSKVFDKLLEHFEEQKKYELERIQWMAAGARQLYDRIRYEAERLQHTVPQESVQPASSKGNDVGLGSDS